MAGQFRRGLIALLLLVAVPVFGGAATAVGPVAPTAAPKPAEALLWADLTVEQKNILAPLASEWDRLMPLQRRRLLMVSKRYLKMNAEQKERVRSRLEEWSKLTPEQRNRARQKFIKLYQLPPEKRQEIKEKWSERQSQPAAAVSPVPSVPVDSSAQGAPTAVSPEPTQ